jgi:hypothetical protein
MSNEDSTEPQVNGTESQPNSADNSEDTEASNQANISIFEQIQSVQQNFQVPTVSTQGTAQTQPATSSLSPEPALEFAQMVELEGGEGAILYYPKPVDPFDIGDVLYLRERDSGENGLIVQAIEKGTANYPQAGSKALFRLMASVRGFQLQRSHHEPPETIDQFLSLQFKVRAAIVNSHWSEHEGRIVTRNVDIFRVSPQFLIENVVLTQP